MNLFGLSRWKPRQLLAAWSTYWAGLVLVTLGPAILAILRVTVPEGAKGSVSAGFDNALFHLVVKAGETTVWDGSAQSGVIAAWIAGPPLLLWIAWLVSRPARHRDEMVGTPPPPLLRDAPVSPHDREKAERERVDRR